MWTNQTDGGMDCSWIQIAKKPLFQAAVFLPGLACWHDSLARLENETWLHQWQSNICGEHLRAKEKSPSPTQQAQIDPPPQLRHKAKPDRGT